MKIGIDAKWYFEGPPSGRRVIRSLVDRLVEINDGNEYYFFFNKKHRQNVFPARNKAKITCCFVWAGNNLLSNVFVLPFYANKYKLEAMLYQNFASPFGQGKKIAYIHDVLFLSNPEYYTLYERLYFAPLRWLARKSDSIVTVSETEKTRLLDFKFSSTAEKISVVYHGVDSSFAPLEEYDNAAVERVKRKFNLPERYLLFVGRLNLRKNIDNLLRAIPLLENKDIPLVIVGSDDWKKSNYRQTIEKLGIGGRIIFTGAVYEDIGIIYALARIFCFPSHAESFGLPPLEAMACGVPVVTSDTTSLPEVCGTAALYASPDKPEEIAAAIDLLLSDEELCKEKKREGIQRAKTFTWSRMAEQVVHCVESCVERI